MTLFEKLERFRKTPELLLFRWTSRNRRVAGDYAYLGDIRLETVSTDGGSVVFSSAAPVLSLRTGKPTVRYSDRNVATIVSGNRKNMNVFSQWVREDEEMILAPNCFSREIKGSVSTSSIERKLFKICGSAPATVARIIEPMLYRLTKNTNSLSPVYNKELKAVIDAQPEDDLVELKAKFQACLELLGSYNEAGYLIPFEYISKGGCVVVNVKGIPYRQGSQVMAMSKRLFRIQCKQLGFDINTGDENADMGPEADGCQPPAADAVDIGDHGTQT